VAITRPQSVVPAAARRTRAARGGAGGHAAAGRGGGQVRRAGATGRGDGQGDLQRGAGGHGAGGPDSERDDELSLAAPFIPPVWYRARPWDPPITNDAAYL